MTGNDSSGTNSDQDTDVNGRDPNVKEGEPIIKDDPIFREIEAAVNHSRHETEVSSSSCNDQEDQKLSMHFNHVPYGFQPRAAYEHHKNNPDIMGVCYNGRFREFVMLDSKGITTWAKDAVEDTVDEQVKRALLYPKYEYRLITNIVYARKHNVYFALGKDFSLKVLNIKFEQTCSVSAGMRSVLFMLFNPVTDELITGGVDGTKVWVFEQAADKNWMEIRAMANYRLRLKYELSNVGGSWVKKVELDQNLQHLYCCSDTDLYAYDLIGNQLFSFKNAHNMSISGCVFSPAANVLITASFDAEMKVWSLVGGHIHTFRGHSRAITNLILHPDCASLVITSSLDGSIRMWSLDMLQEIYNIVVSNDGIMWMGITDDRLLYVSTVRYISVWDFNYTYSFWALTRAPQTKMVLAGAPDKTTRVITLASDSSLRLFSRKDGKNLSTVLPPPPVSPLQQIKAMTYNRELNIVYVLIDPRTLWLYTTRTDSACRLSIWDTHELQKLGQSSVSTIEEDEADESSDIKIKKIKKKGTSKYHPNQRATENGTGKEQAVDCFCVCSLSSPVVMWTEEGDLSPS